MQGVRKAPRPSGRAEGLHLIDANPSSKCNQSVQFSACCNQLPPASAQNSSLQRVNGWQGLLREPCNGVHSRSFRLHCPSVQEASFPANFHLRRLCAKTQSSEPCFDASASASCVDCRMWSIHSSKPPPRRFHTFQLTNICLNIRRRAVCSMRALSAVSAQHEHA